MAMTAGAGGRLVGGTVQAVPDQPRVARDSSLYRMTERIAGRRRVRQRSLEAEISLAYPVVDQKFAPVPESTMRPFSST